MIQLLLDFKEFLRLLNLEQVEYLLVGGYAVNYHGYSRATADMDIWVGADETNARKLLKVLNDFGFGQTGISKQILMQENRIIRMGVPPFRIVVLTGVSGLDFKQSYPHRIVDTIDGVQINIIPLDQLKVNKKSAGRHKDLDDLEQLS